eukprot:COSAG06_NODE_608_length_13862_cov_86.760355_5_plen_265_part_00
MRVVVFRSAFGSQPPPPPPPPPPPCEDDADWTDTLFGFGGCDAIVPNGFKDLCSEMADASGVTASEACGFSCGNTCPEYDNCWDSPCKNGGTCTDGVGSYTCDCPPEFTGPEFTPACEPWPLHYTVTGCSDESQCGVFTRVPANCASGDHCPGGYYANGNTDPTLCDNAPVFQAGGPDGPVLYRFYFDGGTVWRVGPSDRLNDCYPISGYYLVSDLNPGRPGDAPTAPEYNNGGGWYDNGAYGAPITVTAGDGSATGGGGGGGH